MILDTDYITKDGKPIIRIFKKENGEFKIELDPHFQPYIYALLKDDSAIEEIKTIKGERHGKIVRVLDAVKLKKKFLGREVEVWKLIFEHPQDVPAMRSKIREHPAVIDIYEYDIPFAKRYLIDKGLIPMEGDEKLKLLAFDIETFYHEGDEFGKGEIIMISYADEEEARVITWKNIDLPYVDVVSNEREMIKRFVQVVREKDPDVIITYNGDNFDLPYLIKRAEKLGVTLLLGRDKEHPEPKIQRMGDSFAVEIKGRIHFDLFPVVRRTIKLPTYTLEAVYEAVLGKTKSKLSAEEIAAIWETEESMKKLAQYSMEDAKATYELGKEFFPMEAELAKLIGQSVWDVSRSSTGNLVEWYLLRVAYERNELVPNKPNEEEYKRRLRTTYLGGYVKEPEKGLWGNIAYLDFRCHPADTKVLVKGKGIVNISDVEEGDYVFGIDGWQRVRKVWKYYYEGELININGLKCTPNHEIPVVTENDRQTRIRDSLAKSFLSGKVKGKIIITKLFEKIAEFEKNKPSEEEILKGELSGIILAEGTLLRKDIEYFDSSRGKKRISHQYRVEITIGENEKNLLERILYIFDKLFGIKPSVKKKGDTNALKITTAKKAVYLQIEEFLRNIESLYAPAVLRGFFEGDGTVNKIRNTVVATQGTNNKWKIDIVAKLLDRLGIPYSRYEYKYVENGKELTRHILEITGRDGLILFQTLVGFISSEKNEALKKAIEVREMNRLKNNSFYSLSTFEVSSEYYKGKVYDLTLEGNPYYFANGILTHNSLYPSIIVTHNVSPDTLEREGCENYDVAPIVGYKFCKDFPGFIPSILGDLITMRQEIKKKMKATIDPVEKKML
ncbi:MAG TPA: intein-containing DNA-directed DNA polymerase, partial [Thermococcus sp.]|nr:intein-containing DNA-directed DNA polymerase [Thermococcus sp.]